MARIGGIINEMNNRTFIKERRIFIARCFSFGSACILCVMEPVAVIAFLVIGRAVFLPCLDWCVSPMASFSTVTTRGASCVVICPFRIVVRAFRGVVLALLELTFGALGSV